MRNLDWHLTASDTHLHILAMLNLLDMTEHSAWLVKQPSEAAYVSADMLRSLSFSLQAQSQKHYTSDHLEWKDAEM